LCGVRAAARAGEPGGEAHGGRAKAPQGRKMPKGSLVILRIRRILSPQTGGSNVSFAAHVPKSEVTPRRRSRLAVAVRRATAVIVGGQLGSAKRPTPSREPAGDLVQKG